MAAVCPFVVVTARALCLEQEGPRRAPVVFCSSSGVFRSVFVEACSLCLFSFHVFWSGRRLLCKETSAVPVGSLMSNQLSTPPCPVVLASDATDS